jgi:hypothetical protein
MLTDRPNIVIAKRPKPVRKARKPLATPMPAVVYAPSAKTKAAIRKWERLTGR